MRPTNVLEMMKEWKNNPESDEDTTTAEKMKQPAKEKLKSGQIMGNVLDVNDSPSAKAAKQVGRRTVAGSTAQPSLTGTFVQLHHFSVSC